MCDGLICVFENEDIVEWHSSSEIEAMMQQFSIQFKYISIWTLMQQEIEYDIAY